MLLRSNGYGMWHVAWVLKYKLFGFGFMGTLIIQEANIL